MKPLAALLLVVAGIAAPCELPAAQPRTVVADASDLMEGLADSVGVTTRGKLFLAPRLTRLPPAGPAAGAAHAWAAAADARGNVYVGTGSDGNVVRWTPAGAAAVFFATPEPMVSALLLLANGDLLAATAPGGKIYRIGSDGVGRVWCETGEQYVWDLAATANGSIYAATGDRGVLLRIDRNGHADPVFDSDEAHLTALAAAPDDTLVVGSAGSGLVYRVGPENAVRVLFDGDLAEVSDVVVEPDGSILAGFLAAQDPDPRPPAVRIQVPPGAQGSSDNVAGLDDRSVPTLEGIIEGLPSTSEGRASRRSRGRVVRILPSGVARELWRSSTETVLAVGLDAERRPIFGTGEPARVYRIGAAAEVERLATLPEGQVTAIRRAGDGVVLATSNPAAAYRFDGKSAAQGSFVSHPLDADAPARWGPVRWRTTGAPPGAGVQFQARSGNCAEPDATWSGWSKPVAAPDAPQLVPDGRFLQWRARFEATDPALRLEEITLTFTPYNRPPVVDSFRIDGSKTSFSDKVPLRWSVLDSDDDPVLVQVEYRPAGSAEWEVGLRVDPRGGSDEVLADADETDGKGSWDVAAVAEGEYELRVTASDVPSNRAGEGFEEPSPRRLRVTLDRTPPQLRVRSKAADRVEIEAEDSLSPVGCLQITEDGRAIETLAPEDGVCDGRRELFVLRRDATEGTLRSLRLEDAAGNSTAMAFPER